MRRSALESCESGCVEFVVVVVSSAGSSFGCNVGCIVGGRVAGVEVAAVDVDGELGGESSNSIHGGSVPLCCGV